MILFFSQTRDNIKYAMVAIIEAHYIILGYPDIAQRQNLLSLDKYFEPICAYKITQLGIDINSIKTSICLTEKKRISILDEISHWSTQRRSFNLL